jgi:protease I
MGRLSGKKVLMVVAPSQFRDEEYFQPKVIIQASGAIVETTADTKEEEATGTQGGKAKIDLPLGRVKPASYAAIVFVGGPGAKGYFQDKQAKKLAQEFAQPGKVVGAICIAPTILANAGVLAGKKATAFSSELKKLQAKKAQVIKQAVVVDGNIVTAEGPEAALEFGRKLVDVLAAQ